MRRPELDGPGPRRLCLVTGASSGIGAALARAYAARGFDLALTARRSERLEALAAELRAGHGATVLVLPGDQGVPDACDVILGRIAEAGRTVDVLVNNAGYGLEGAHVRTPWPALETMLQVMLVAVTQTTQRVLPGMVERRYGRILNVASLAGLMPGQSGAPLYNAIKAYLVRYSQSLHEETLGRGVHVTALCPGFTYSEFHDVSGSREVMKTLPSWMWMTAEAVAEAGYAAAEANRAVYVPGAANQALGALFKVLPDSWITAAVGRRRPRKARAEPAR